MDIILGLVQYFVDLGAAVMLPIVIFIVAICLGQSVGKSYKIWYFYWYWFYRYWSCYFINA